MNLRTSIVALLVLVSCPLAFAQTSPQKIASINTGSVKKVYIDRLGDYYVQTTTDVISKYDMDGAIQGSYQPPQSPTCFDPWNGMKLFLYYKDDRKYAWVDRFMHFFEDKTLDPAFAIQPVLACPGDQNKIWVLDAADWSLKHVNTRIPSVELDQPIEVSPGVQFSSMREYQNFLFLHDPSRGLYIYNILGIAVDTIPGTFNDYNFLGEELYYLKEGQLMFYDLFDGRKRTKPLPEPADFALITDDRLMIIHGGQMDIFRLSASN